MENHQKHSWEMEDYLNLMAEANLRKKVSLKSGKGNFPNGNISAKIDFLLSTVELPTKQFQNYVFESVPGVCNL